MYEKGSTFTELASFDMKSLMIPTDGKPLTERAWRLRHVSIEPGGVVGYHGHANRPAIFHILSGTVTEYHSEFAEPRIRSVGSTTLETGDIYHWWRNEGDETAYLIVTDLYDDGTKSEGC